MNDSNAFGDAKDGVRLFQAGQTAPYDAMAKPGYPERVAMLVQIGDHLSKQFDVAG